MRQVPKDQKRMKKIKLRLLIVACLVATAVLVHPGLFHSAKADGGSAGTWAQTFSSGFPEFGASNAIQQTSDGGYILVGNTNVGRQAWAIRLDASGNVIWENAYSGAGHAGARSVQQTSDGGFIIAGDTSGSGFASVQAWVLRLDGDGNVIWENAYSGAGSAGATSVQQTSDGGFIVAGDTSGPGLASQAWVLRLDQDGNVNWENAYGPAFSIARGVQQTDDGGFIVAGGTSFFGPCCGNAWVFRLDSDGNIVWENTYGVGNEFAWSVQQTSDGGFVVGVEDLTSIANSEAAAVILLDGDGNIVWQHAYSTPNGCNAAVSVKQTSDNGFIVGTACDNTVLRLDDQGDIVWQNTYNGFADVDSVQQTSDGGFVLAGCCTNFAAPAAFVAKIDSNGQIGSSCASITPSTLTQSDTSYTVTPTSATVTDTSSLDTVAPTSSTVTDTSSTDTVTLLCQD